MANTVSVNAAIRKIDNPDLNKEFVLFIQKKNGEIISVLVQDDIIDGSLKSVREAYDLAKNNNSLYAYYKGFVFENLEINAKAKGTHRTNVTEAFDLQDILESDTYYKTSTSDHRHYIKQ